jgi:hypothetical protein
MTAILSTSSSEQTFAQDSPMPDLSVKLPTTVPNESLKPTLLTHHSAITTIHQLISSKRVVTTRADALNKICGQEAKIPNLQNVTPEWAAGQHPRVEEVRGVVDGLLKT